MFRNIVFDFGGVIAEMTRENSVRAFAALGLPDADSRLDKYHQTGIFQELEEGRLSADAFRDELGKLCGRTPTPEETTHAWRMFFAEADVRKLRLIESLREQYRIYLLSNTNPFVMSWARSSAFSSDGKPLDHYFDGLYLSFEAGHTKPAPEIFEYMIADSGIDPHESLLVDDGSANVAAGRRFGFATLQPDNGEDWRRMLLDTLKG